MSKRTLSPSTALFPVPVVMVTCGRGNANIITIAWVGTVCSEPPMLSISVRSSRYSHQLIMENREFVVNIPSQDQLEASDYCGVTSGRKVDKFATSGLTPLPASKVGAPLIAECPVNIECKVVHLLNLGTHDMFVARIEAVHADESVLDEGGRIDGLAARPFVSVLGRYCATGEELGRQGLSVRKSKK